MADFTHFTDDGRPQMVNVGEKAETRRTAIAGGQVVMSPDTLQTVKSGALTVYDMCKAVDKAMIIRDIRLLHKSGGKSGTFNAD